MANTIVTSLKTHGQWNPHPVSSVKNQPGVENAFCYLMNIPLLYKVQAQLLNITDSSDFQIDTERQ